MNHAINSLSNFLSSETSDASSILPLLSYTFLENALTDGGQFIRSSQSTDLFDFSPLSGVPALLRYLYYAGCACIRMQRYTQAKYFFLVCLSIPSQSCSVIQLRAYEKYSLTSVIANGSYTELPKHTSSAINQAIKTYCKKYEDFCLDLTYANVCDRFNVNRNKFGNDRNVQLAQRAVHAVYLNAIIELQACFISISKANLMRHIQLENETLVDSYLCYLRDHKNLDVQVRNGMVYFGSTDQHINSGADLNLQLSKDLDELKGLHDQLLELQKSVNLQTFKEINPKKYSRPSLRDSMAREADYE